MSELNDDGELDRVLTGLINYTAKIRGHELPYPNSKLVDFHKAKELIHQRDESRDKASKSTKYICCDELEKALGDHKGLYSQTISSPTSGKTDSVVMYVGGEYTYRKGPIIVQYCPFCGKARIRASEHQPEKGNSNE